MEKIVKYHFWISLIFLPFVLMGQEENTTCLTVDFETINEIIPTDGMIISNQFFAEYGVTFELEDGNSPRIAQVGGIATAFGSSLGSDQPLPNQNIGTFFITDDGLLSGLQAIPLIVRFDNPLDSLSAFILDMDFDEVFTVDARDANEDIIFTTVIRAGDPETGDGIATPFGFNLDGCEGAIYSLRFEGTRNSSGAFGLGMDNFTFCFSGIDIQNNITASVIEANCNTNGGIIINNESDIPYQYSLDSISFSEQDTFLDLNTGIYNIYIQDEDDCSATLTLEVPIAPPVGLDIDGVAQTSCGDNNGSVTLISTGTDVAYALDLGAFSISNSFDSLAPGIYTIYAQDIYECLDSISLTIDPSFPPSYSIASLGIDFCGNGVGNIELFGPPNNMYSLDGGDFTSSMVFENVTAGIHIIQINDGNGCLVDTTITIDSTAALLFVNASSSPTNCDQMDGSISISTSGGTGSTTLIFDQVIQDTFSPTINDLDLGTYLIQIEDEVGCTDIRQVTVDQNICPVFVPNIFSPNGDGVNDDFPLFTLQDYDAEILRYMVFDRWGNKVFDSKNFSIHDASYWWDGKSNGRNAEPGVYAYTVDILHPNATIERKAGDVTLIR